MNGMVKMARTKDSKYKELTYDEIVEIDGKKVVKTITKQTNNYQSRRDSSKAYHKKLDTIAVRVPEGKTQIIRDYVTNNISQEEHPELFVKKKDKDSGKILYEPSLNAFIKSLIEHEIGQSLD